MCCCAFLAAASASLALILATTESGTPALSREEACRTCPERQCADYGFAPTLALTTEEGISQGRGLADCICVVCREECRPLHMSFFNMQWRWVAGKLWFDNVAAINGVCVPEDGACTYDTVCSQEGPRIAGPACIGDLCEMI